MHAGMIKVQANEFLIDIYNDALANWHTLNESEKNQDLSGIGPLAFCLPDENFTTAPQRITMVLKQI